MRRQLEYLADASCEGLTIEQFLRQNGYSHHVLTHLKRTESGITRNGVWAYTNQKLCAGDLLGITILEDSGSDQIRPTEMPLAVVYEDEDLMVIDKPADLPIHPSVNHHDYTLANGLMYYFSSRNIPFTYRCINRLDRDTSGLLIIAKHILSGALLSAMSARREIHREYLAVAEGILPESGTIDAAIARAPDSAIMRCVDPVRGETAVTHFRRVLCGADASAALVRLETGRTHQIRVHMAHIGHPLLGDFLYNPPKHPDGTAIEEWEKPPQCDPRGAFCHMGNAVSHVTINRQALHSCRLSFIHPITHQPLSFQAEPPDDIKTLICDMAPPE